jgi:CRP/FNR family cyclic AMP-dependent transcriptional regulator
MVSPELIRRYPFFSRLNSEQIDFLAKVADEEILEEGHFFFREDEETNQFFLLIEGAVGIIFEVPERQVKQKLSDQFARKLQTKDIVISTVSPGEVFGWTGLVPPHIATAGAKTLTPCRVIKFNTKELMDTFEDDCRFGYIMTQKAAQVMRDRLHDMRIESLAYFQGA